MPRSKKPKTQFGEFEPAITVAYQNHERPELSGKYTVELGAEFQELFKTYRWVRVDGEVFHIYAMVRKGRRSPISDRQILRNGYELRNRAVETYVNLYLLPRLEAQRQEEQKQEYLRNLSLPHNWSLELTAEAIRIQPIGLMFYLGPEATRDHEEAEKKTTILARMLELVQQHGLT